MGKFYKVLIREIYNNSYLVEADSVDEAREAADMDEGVEVDFDFFERMEPKYWGVTEVSEEDVMKELTSSAGEEG